MLLSAASSSSAVFFFLLSFQIEFLAKAAACDLAAAFDKQLLDRSSVVFVKQNINQGI